jgi:hypothetical protein
MYRASKQYMDLEARIFLLGKQWSQGEDGRSQELLDTKPGETELSPVSIKR